MRTPDERAALRNHLLAALQQRFGQLSESWTDEEIVDFIIDQIGDEPDHEQRIRQLEMAVWPTQGRP